MTRIGKKTLNGNFEVPAELRFQHPIKGRGTGQRKGSLSITNTKCMAQSNFNDYDTTKEECAKLDYNANPQEIH